MLAPMGKPPKPPNKKPPVSSGPMTFGNMRSPGPRDLHVWCKACDHHTTINVDAYPDDMPVLSLGPRMRCTQSNHLGATRSLLRSPHARG
jgi:hypothetical protein